MRIARVGLLLLAIAGCKDARLSRTSGELQAPAAFDVGWAVVGSTRHAPLALENTSPTTMHLTLAASGDFSAAKSLDVPSGGGSATIDFTPSATGRETGTLTISGDASATVNLVGQGLDKAPCPTAAACHVVDYDPDTNACRDTTLPDGSPCSASACIAGAVCQHGACIGQAQSCDDGNACTDDLCDATLGCVHQDNSARCPTPSDPCKVSTCDPANGCGVTDAPDGTVCGSVDCATAHICIEGGCVNAPVPDGSPCALATPCQGQGTCQNETCVQPAQTQMQPVWSYTVDPATTLTFPGVQDDDGELYWYECLGDGGCDLVSFTPGGFPRWRAHFDSAPIGSPWDSSSTILAQRDQLIIGLSSGAIEARATRDGSLLWTTSPSQPELPVMPDGGPNGNITPMALAELTPDVIAATFEIEPYTYLPNSPGSTIVLLNAHDGGVQQLIAISGGTYGLVVDASQRAWVGEELLYPDSGVAYSIAAIDANGAVVSQLANAGGPVLAAFPGGVVVNEGTSWVMLASDGGASTLPENSYGWYGWYGMQPIADADVAYAINNGYCCEACDDVVSSCGPSILEAFDPFSGGQRWSTSDGGEVLGPTQPELTDGDDVLFAIGPTPLVYTNADTPAALGGPAALVAYDSSGNQLFDCPIENDAGWGFFSGSAFGDERWFLARQDGSGSRIEAYATPGMKPATSGWVTHGGSPQRLGHPR